MKQHWQRYAMKIDALTLRERVIIFAMAALILILLINAFLLEPKYAQQKQLSQRIEQERQATAALRSQIQQQASMQNGAAGRGRQARLQQLQQQTVQMQAALADMEKGLISPDRMSSLLGDILRQHQALRLMSLKTLPVAALGENPAAPASQSATMADDLAPTSAVYRHGVEVVVQGGYFDLMNYLAQMETMPWQLLWAKAELEVGEHPVSNLKLTLYTLSLDRKWLNL